MFDDESVVVLIDLVGLENAQVRRLDSLSYNVKFQVRQQPCIQRNLLLCVSFSVSVRAHISVIAGDQYV